MNENNHVNEYVVYALKWADLIKNISHNKMSILIQEAC